VKKWKGRQVDSSGHGACMDRYGVIIAVRCWNLEDTHNFVVHACGDDGALLRVQRHMGIQ
jgi:hypothetical protein